MMVRRSLYGVVGALTLLVALGGSAVATEPISATLGGDAISLKEASSLSCHDFDYPILRCFVSVSEMERVVTERVRGQAKANGTLGGATTGYVTAYEHAQYAGSALTLSADQPWLLSIGWNDRISSFKSFGATGNFQENSPGGGFVYFFTSSSQVPSLSGTYNDKFSSFDIN